MFEFALDGHKVIKIATKKKITLKNETIIAIIEKHGVTITKERYKNIINGREVVSSDILEDISKILKCDWTDIMLEYSSFAATSRQSNNFGVPKGNGIRNQTWGNGDRESQNSFIGNGKFTKMFSNKNR